MATNELNNQISELIPLLNASQIAIVGTFLDGIAIGLGHTAANNETNETNKTTDTTNTKKD